MTSPAACLLSIHTAARTSGPLGGCRQLPSAVAAFSAGRRVGADTCSCQPRRLFGVLAWSPVVKPWSNLQTGRLCGGARDFVSSDAGGVGQRCCRSARDGHKCVDIPEAQEGTRIPTVSKIQVLGLWLEEHGANHELIARLQKKVATATHLVCRAANKRKGMKEHNVTRLIQAYALSHTAYVVALLELGVHNMLEEIAEAQRIMQLDRLSGTRTGRWILSLLGIRYHEARGQKEALLQELRDALQTEDMS
ncbi:hypothetical protein HPB50_020002 [Hyalomma asiaticum]|uniref:Uncharacterized protein n=1 Tax=Hyalomma asiaticum TaxID=266040 RepID=A0ACB7RKG3_HYAAI|nr:hypothetical protein HPB50_020002 [Hyalomma asiaticum]